MVHQIVSTIGAGYAPAAKCSGNEFCSGGVVVTFDGLVTRTLIRPADSHDINCLARSIGYPVDIEFAHDGMISIFSSAVHRIIVKTACRLKFPRTSRRKDSFLLPIVISPMEISPISLTWYC